jgi:hypothetical protein
MHPCDAQWLKACSTQTTQSTCWLERTAAIAWQHAVSHVIFARAGTSSCFACS